MAYTTAQSLPLLGWMDSLADATRIRLLRLLEQHELNVMDLCEIMQLPQSTVSRHLKVLADQGWVTSRRSGTTNLYRTILDELAPPARELWIVARSQTDDWASTKQDQVRLQRRLRSRRQQAREFFAGVAGDWENRRHTLYGDGFDAVKKEYVEKIDTLKKTGDKLESRQHEDSNRKATCDQLRRVVDSNKQWCADTTNEKFLHISDEDRDVIRAASTQAENWLFDMLDKQGNLSKNQDPVLTLDLLSSKMKELFSKCNPIMTKLKPKPKEEPKPEPEPETAKADAPAGENGEETSADGAAKEGDADPDAAESKMEVEDKVD